MKVCHFSDWHRNFRRLPEADLYVCTGDMLPNFPLIRYQPDKWKRELIYWDPEGDVDPPPGAYARGRLVSPEREIEKQRLWISKQNFRKDFLPNPDAPIICVRGNHDFVPLAELFGGDVWEATDDPTRTTTIQGLTVGGCRGVNFIQGEWTDELYGSQFDERAEKLPDNIDLLLTHSPPYGLLDFYGGSYVGSRALRRYVNKRSYSDSNIRAHFFGHIHEAFGSRNAAGTVFSNAATGHVLFEI